MDYMKQKDLTERYFHAFQFCDFGCEFFRNTKINYFWIEDKKNYPFDKLSKIKTEN